jgi:hypothetical protein
MPWELTLVNYDGKPPRFRKDADERRELPLGTLEEVRKHISTVLPEIEWSVEPPLIEMMKATGSNLWEDWDEEMKAAASIPKLQAVYYRENLSIEMFGFEQNGPLRFVLMDVRGSDNPIPILRKLCEPRGWSFAEMSKDGEFLDLSGNDTRWDNWQHYLNYAIDQVQDSDE